MSSNLQRRQIIIYDHTLTLTKNSYTPSLSNPPRYRRPLTAVLTFSNGTLIH